VYLTYLLAAQCFTAYTELAILSKWRKASQVYRNNRASRQAAGQMG
jgi:hypothetical protein